MAMREYFSVYRMSGIHDGVECSIMPDCEKKKKFRSLNIEFNDDLRSKA